LHIAVFHLFIHLPSITFTTNYTTNVSNAFNFAKNLLFFLRFTQKKCKKTGSTGGLNIINSANQQLKASFNCSINLVVFRDSALLKQAWHYPRYLKRWFKFNENNLTPAGFCCGGYSRSVSCATLAYGYSPLATAWFPFPRPCRELRGTHTVKSGVKNKKLFEVAIGNKFLFV